MRRLALALLLVPATASAQENGRAAPPTAAGTSGIIEGPVTAGLDTIAQYAFRSSQDISGASSWYHLFDVPRAHAAVQGRYGPAIGRVVIEAVPSASNGALVGVAGDSFVMRLREGFVGFRYPSKPATLDWSVEGHAGAVPTITLPEIEGTWMMRAVAPSALETSGLAAPADLGATARFDFPKRYGFIATGAYNGEGYTNRELNRGKNWEIAGEVHPLANDPNTRPLGIFASFNLGSSGTGSAQNNRLTTAAVWQGRLIRGGVSFTYAWGVKDAPDQKSFLVDLFVRAEPFENALVGARFSFWNVNVGSSESIAVFTPAIGYRLFRPLEVYLATDISVPTTAALAAMPDSHYFDLRVIGRCVF